jgi:deoxyadenosine/deoxycytidine kinase
MNDIILNKYRRELFHNLNSKYSKWVQDHCAVLQLNLNTKTNKIPRTNLII